MAAMIPAAASKIFLLKSSLRATDLLMLLRQVLFLRIAFIAPDKQVG
jgi:hypothetical protein